MRLLLLFPIFFATLLATDQVDITGMARCGLTTNFFRTQFSPFLGTFSSIPAELNITYHPLSIGSKTTANGSKIAVCSNGELECELNKLQCCSKKYVKNYNSTVLLATIACIQGKTSLEQGILCLKNEKNAGKIKTCAKSEEGVKLLLAEPFPHNYAITLPWIKINGVRNAEAGKNFQKVICQLKSAKNEESCKKR